MTDFDRIFPMSNRITVMVRVLLRLTLLRFLRLARKKGFLEGTLRGSLHEESGMGSKVDSAWSERNHRDI